MAEAVDENAIKEGAALRIILRLSEPRRIAVTVQSVGKSDRAGLGAPPGRAKLPAYPAVRLA
jgi:hypothetical protein